MSGSRAIIVALYCSWLGGCSVYMAANQPSAKNLDLLAVGTQRSLLLVEYGAPIMSETRDGHKYEIFKFKDGYRTSTKAGRAVLHGAADVMTLGLWEIVGTPTEAAFSGDEMAFQVRYDKDERVDEVVALKSQ